MSLHYLSCLGRTGTYSTKKRGGTCYTEHGFLHQAESTGHVVHSNVSGVRNLYALYFMLESDRYGFHKKRTWTRYTKLVLSHLVGSTGHVVHFGASGV
jgi:hypothetical protein